MFTECVNKCLFSGSTAQNEGALWTKVYVSALSVKMQSHYLYWPLKRSYNRERGNALWLMKVDVHAGRCDIYVGELSEIVEMTNLNDLNMR